MDDQISQKNLEGSEANEWRSEEDEVDEQLSRELEEEKRKIRAEICDLEADIEAEKHKNELLRSIVNDNQAKKDEVIGNLKKQIQYVEQQTENELAKIHVEIEDRRRILDKQAEPVTKIGESELCLHAKQEREERNQKVPIPAKDLEFPSDDDTLPLTPSQKEEIDGLSYELERLKMKRDAHMSRSVTLDTDFEETRVKYEQEKKKIIQETKEMEAKKRLEVVNLESMIKMLRDRGNSRKARAKDKVQIKVLNKQLKERIEALARINQELGLYQTQLMHRERIYGRTFSLSSQAQSSGRVSKTPRIPTSDRNRVGRLPRLPPAVLRRMSGPLI
jgi:hypothetical protein